MKVVTKTDGKYFRLDSGVDVPVKKYIENLYRGIAGAHKQIKADYDAGGDDALIQVFRDKQLDIDGGGTVKPQAYDPQYFGRGKRPGTTHSKTSTDKPADSGGVKLPKINVGYIYRNSGKEWTVTGITGTGKITLEREGRNPMTLTPEKFAELFEFGGRIAVYSEQEPSPTVNRRGRDKVTPQLIEGAQFRSKVKGTVFTILEENENGTFICAGDDGNEYENVSRKYLLEKTDYIGINSDTDSDDDIEPDAEELEDEESDSDDDSPAERAELMAEIRRTVRDEFGQLIAGTFADLERRIAARDKA